MIRHFCDLCEDEIADAKPGPVMGTVVVSRNGHERRVSFAITTQLEDAAVRCATILCQACVATAMMEWVSIPEPLPGEAPESPKDEPLPPGWKVAIRDIPHEEIWFSCPCGNDIRHSLGDGRKEPVHFMCDRCAKRYTMFRLEKERAVVVQYVRP